MHFKLGSCERVIDGDTVEILFEDDYEPTRMRLFGIDTVELRQDFGMEAKEILTNLVLNKEVSVMHKGKDKFGRIVGTVYITEYDENGYERLVDLSSIMVSRGYGVITQNSYKDEFKYAKENGLKIHSLPDFELPSIFRKKNKKQRANSFENFENFRKKRSYTPKF